MPPFMKVVYLCNIRGSTAFPRENTSSHLITEVNSPVGQAKYDCLAAAIEASFMCIQPILLSCALHNSAPRAASKGD